MPALPEHWPCGCTGVGVYLFRCMSGVCPGAPGVAIFRRMPGLERFLTQLLCTFYAARKQFISLSDSLTHFISCLSFPVLPDHSLGFDQNLLQHPGSHPPPAAVNDFSESWALFLLHLVSSSSLLKMAGMLPCTAPTPCYHVHP